MAVLSPSPVFQFINSDGSPLFGGKVYTYAAGTTTPKATYTDEGGATANPNPVILDAFGSAAIWLGDGSYKFIIKTSDDATIRTVDDILGETSTTGPFLTSSNGSATNVQTGRSATVGLFYPSGTNVAVATNGTERVRVAATGQLLTTYATSVNTLTVNDGALTPLVQSTNDGTTGLGISGYLAATFSTTSTAGGVITLAGANSNNAGTFTTIAGSGYTLGSVRFDGSDGTDFSTGAVIRAVSTAAATAGVVPTDLAFLTKAAAGSLTEKIRMTGDGRLYGTALHNNAGAMTGVTNQYIASGTYTPGAINISNLDSITPNPCQWLRVGNVVTVSGSVDIDPTTTALLVEFRLLLPIVSDFTNTSQLAGTGVANGGGTAIPFRVLGNTSDDDAAFLGYPTATVSHTMGFSFTYVVLT